MTVRIGSCGGAMGDRCLRGCYNLVVDSAIRHEIVAREVRRVRCELLGGCADFSGILRLQALDQCIRRRARGAVRPQLVPETRRVQAALGLVESTRMGREGLDLLHQPGNVMEAVGRDRGRHLPEMVTVLDELSEEGRLLRVVLEWDGRGRQVRKRRRVEDRLDPGIALRDVDDVAMDIVDRTPDKLPEIRAQDRRSGCRGCTLDRGDLLVELIDDNLCVQTGEIVDLRRCRTQHLLDGGEVRHDLLDLIRSDTADHAGRCAIE